MLQSSLPCYVHRGLPKKKSAGFCIVPNRTAAQSWKHYKDAMEKLYSSVNYVPCTVLFSCSAFWREVCGCQFMNSWPCSARAQCLVEMKEAEKNKHPWHVERQCFRAYARMFEAPRRGIGNNHLGLSYYCKADHKSSERISSFCYSSLPPSCTGIALMARRLLHVYRKGVPESDRERPFGRGGSGKA